MQQQQRRFSDFAEEEQPLEGGKLRLDDLVNREVLVTGHKIRSSKYKDKGSGKCLTLQVEVDGETHIAFTGSSVLIDQLERYRDQIPFLATIKKIDRYYTFT